jgi:hypothetical protein
MLLMVTTAVSLAAHLNRIFKTVFSFIFEVFPMLAAVVIPLQFRYKYSSA